MIHRLAALLYALGVTAVALTAAWVLVAVASFPPPPPRPADSHGSALRDERGAQHVMRLQGDPYALGLHNARLLGDYMNMQERLLIDNLMRFAKAPWRAMLIHRTGMFYLLGFHNYLSEEERLEIRGLADGGEDLFPELGPRFGRIAAYHAAHELSHRFAFDNPLWACSLVAVGSTRGAEGHTLLARNFDFEGGAVFDTHKVVLAVRPSQGYGFVSVVWAGMAGVVSGINEHGLVIVLNAGASADYRRVGAPTTLLIRRALQYARTIDEAVAILTATPTFVSDILGLADRSGRVAVLELTPERHGLREGPLLIATNHMLSAELRADPVSLARSRSTTTLQRHDSLQQWVARQRPGPTLDAAALQQLMRQRTDARGKPLPIGHRHAVDALIATHSVIFDATAGRLWVSEGPHTLGPYHGYDVAALLAAEDRAQLRGAYLPSLPEDPLLPIAPLAARAVEAWQEIRTALDNGALERAEAALTDAAALGDHPVTLTLRGELAAARGDRRWAAAFWRQALRSPPEYRADVARIEALLAALSSAGNERP